MACFPMESYYISYGNVMIDINKQFHVAELKLRHSLRYVTSSHGKLGNVLYVRESRENQKRNRSHITYTYVPIP